jgi:DNA-binding GntR family transcriptional regulator
MPRETSREAIRRPAALADAAYDRLRSDLLERGPLTAGGRIVAGDLAARLGMSRTPVREALDRLGRIGYLERLDGGGYQRRRYRTRDARDLHELRLLLEPVGAELAAADRSRGPGPDARSFHADVASASGNRVLAHVIELLTERVSAMRTDLEHEGRQRSRASVERERRIAHAAVADAIRRGDGPAARRAMAEHLTFEARGVLTRTAPVEPGASGADA